MHKTTTILIVTILLASLIPVAPIVQRPPSLPTFHSPKEPPMRIQHWQQDQFLTPNRYQYRWPGDFYSLDAFIPARDGQSLKRMPAWTGHIDFVADFVEPKGALYDATNAADNYFIFIGTSEATSPQDTIGVMTIAQSTLNTGGIYSIGNAGTLYWRRLGGLHRQNVLWHNDDFWVIPADDKCYRVGSYTGGSRTAEYTGDTIAIIPTRDTLFLVNDDDDLYRWDPDTSSFEAYFETRMELEIKHIIHYRQDFILFTQASDGSLIIHQIPDRPPASLKQLIHVPSQTATFVPRAATADWGTPWTLHNDRIYFSPGIYWDSDNDAETLPIWRFDGNSVELVENVDAPIVPNAWGLLEWRGRMILYLVGSSSQHVYAYHRGRFVQVLDSAFTCADWADIYSLGGHLWMPYEDSGTQGWTRLDDYEDSVFVSSWLDLGRPTQQKHLLSLAAVVSDAVEDFNVKIEYRTESGSWTTAANTANARHIIGEDLEVDFYLLQVRITFDDDTGDNEDIELQSLGVTYSYGR